jgi:hypothetical protein
MNANSCSLAFICGKNVKLLTTGAPAHWLLDTVQYDAYHYQSDLATTK